jgi:hypothetical protein
VFLLNVWATWQDDSNKFLIQHNHILHANEEAWEGKVKGFTIGLDDDIQAYK